MASTANRGETKIAKISNLITLINIVDSHTHTTQLISLSSVLASLLEWQALGRRSSNKPHPNCQR